MRFEKVRRLGAWERPHPYVGAFIGAEALVEVLPAVLDTLPIGEGHRGTFFVAPDDVPPLMALPEAQDVVFLSFIYPQVSPRFLDKRCTKSSATTDKLPYRRLVSNGSITSLRPGTRGRRENDRSQLRYLAGRSVQ